MEQFRADMGEKRAVQKSICSNSISCYLFAQILISQFPQESYHFFELKYILFLFFQRQLTKGFNFPYRTYSFRAVFKFHSFWTLSKALVFLVHVFTLKCLKILLWMDSHSHKPRIINVFNAKIAKIFPERLISCWKFFPKFHVTYRIGVGYHFLLSLQTKHLSLGKLLSYLQMTLKTMQMLPVSVNTE